MARSVWKGPFVDIYLIKKAEAVRNSGRNDVIKIWSRRSTITSEFVGLTFGVHNGKKHIPVTVNENMVGHNLENSLLQEHTKDTMLTKKRLNFWINYE